MLDAAVRSLASGDPGAVSASRIAKESGATWGAVQYQFGGQGRVLSRLTPDLNLKCIPSEFHEWVVRVSTLRRYSMDQLQETPCCATHSPSHR
jgi:Bacterial regulatory proteins, tetR family